MAKKKKVKVRVNGRTLTSETLQDRSPVISKLEEILIRWITKDTVLSGEITNITDKIRLGIRISAFRMVLERLKQLCEFNPEPKPKVSPEPRQELNQIILVEMAQTIGSPVDPSTIVFSKCSNMSQEYFGKANPNSPNNYDLVVHLGSREDFQVFAAYRASESFAHPTIFKGYFKP
jgi:hypothetical protein